MSKPVDITKSHVVNFIDLLIENDAERLLPAGYSLDPTQPERVDVIEVAPAPVVNGGDAADPAGLDENALIAERSSLAVKVVNQWRATGQFYDPIELIDDTNPDTPSLSGVLASIELLNGQTNTNPPVEQENLLFVFEFPDYENPDPFQALAERVGYIEVSIAELGLVRQYPVSANVTIASRPEGYVPQLNVTALGNEPLNFGDNEVLTVVFALFARDEQEVAAVGETENPKESGRTQALFRVLSSDPALPPVQCKFVYHRLSLSSLLREKGEVVEDGTTVKITAQVGEQVDLPLDDVERLVSEQLGLGELGEMGIEGDVYAPDERLDEDTIWHEHIVLDASHSLVYCGDARIELVIKKKPVIDLGSIESGFVI